MIIAVAVGSSATAKEAIADWLGIGQTAIVAEPEPPATTDSARPRIESLLGPRVEPSEVRARLSFEPTVLDLGVDPTHHLLEVDGAPALVLVYQAGPELPAINDASIGAILTQRPVDDAPLFTKSGTVDQIVEVDVDGLAGFWFEGEHELDLPMAEIRAGNTLLWVDGSVELRLESGLGVDEAVAVVEGRHP